MKTRAAGYAVDMVIFAAIVMVLFVVAGAEALIVTRGATDDSNTDPAIYGFLAIIGIGAPVVWTAMNLALLRLRGQTGGQYVAGVRVVQEDGTSLRAGTALKWWFALNPVLFSWMMALTIGFPTAGVVALALSRASIAVFGGIVLLCALAPVVAVIAAVTDSRNRALHDRLAGTVVVPVE